MRNVKVSVFLMLHAKDLSSQSLSDSACGLQRAKLGLQLKVLSRSGGEEGSLHAAILVGPEGRKEIAPTAGRGTLRCRVRTVQRTDTP